MTGAEFTRALGRRGYNLRSSQDGAHELYHALTSGVLLAGEPWNSWQREELNCAIERKFPGIDRWWNEVEARVVERLVCRRLRDERALRAYDKALELSIEEAEHYGVPHRPFDETVDYARAFETTKRARAAVDVILAYAAREAVR